MHVKKSNRDYVNQCSGEFNMRVLMESADKGHLEIVDRLIEH